MPTPDLILAGAQKSGTTSLHAYLRAHPRLEMSEPKEPHILAHVESDDDARAAYDEVFPIVTDRDVRIETGTEYLILPGIPERIRRVCGGVKLAFIFRNPVDRAWSQYRWLTSLGIERRPFRTAFSADLDDVPDIRTDIRGHMRYYFTHGRYGRHLARYHEVFDREALLVLVTEQLATDPTGTLRSMVRHAGVEPIDLTPRSREYVTRSLHYPRLTNVLYGHEVVHHARTDLAARILHRIRHTIATTRGVHGAARRIAAQLERRTRDEPVLAKDDRRWLATYYAEDVDELRDLTGLPLSEWERDFPRHG